MADDRQVAASWAAAARTSYWLDTPHRPAPRAALSGSVSTDLAVIGAGYTGLWTALRAKDRDPARDVLLIDAERIGGAASGRNGGFCAASLTHGESNGRTRFPDEYEQLHRLGLQNLDDIEKAVQHHAIDCDFRRTGDLLVATEPYQVEGLRAAGGEFLDATAVRRELNSPTYLAGRWERTGVALVDPARLAWGLADVVERLGVRIAEHTPALDLRRDGETIVVRTGSGTVRARQVALATNAYQPLLRRLRLHIVPVYDHVLVTEPLAADQLRGIGWRNRQGVGDAGNQFHYYRLTADDRILWGGYDAIYHFGRRVRPRHDDSPITSHTLARHFFETFPQLEGLRFTHAWGGAIDTCTRFCPFFGTAMRGRVAYALGYTGLGVGASRFGADVMLDLLEGRPTERTELEFVRRRPLPFPPEPFAYAGIQATRWSLARADRNEGRRNLWLRTLDRFGLGFDS
ncbi:MAG TPA: FAD-binding oxidoreductase [Pseudonocardia sp.]|nr:FAD-binding oxidoreductase [Pseudonocardia sp.]